MRLKSPSFSECRGLVEASVWTIFGIQQLHEVMKACWQLGRCSLRIKAMAFAAFMRAARYLN